MKPKIVALVPMRHYSERVPSKNYRDFNGKPLFYWIIETLCSCNMIEAIYINTDSPVIRGRAPGINSKVSIVDRPANLCSGETPMNDILLYDVSQVEADYYLQTHSTNPLLMRETIEEAIKRLLSSHTNDSLFGVTRLQRRLWDQNGCPLNHNPNLLLRTQDLPSVYEENSNIYIFTKEVIQKYKNRVGKNPIMFEIARNEAWDIDGEIDFHIAEILHKERIKTDVK